MCQLRMINNIFLEINLNSILSCEIVLSSENYNILLNKKLYYLKLLLRDQ